MTCQYIVDILQFSFEILNRGKVTQIQIYYGCIVSTDGSYLPSVQNFKDKFKISTIYKHVILGEEMLTCYINVTYMNRFYGGILFT